MKNLNNIFLAGTIMATTRVMVPMMIIYMMDKVCVG